MFLSRPNGDKDFIAIIKITLGFSRRMNSLQSFSKYWGWMVFFKDNKFAITIQYV